MVDSSETESTTGPSSSKEPEKPHIEPLRLPTVDDIRGQEIWNNCFVRSAFSGIVGGGLGLFMGLFFGALDSPLHQDEMGARQQFTYTVKQMGKKSFSSAKTFAVMGVIFSAAECVVEKARAKHDTTNTAVAGCATGGILSAKDCIRVYLWRMNGINKKFMFSLNVGAFNVVDAMKIIGVIPRWSESSLLGLCRFRNVFGPD